MNKNGYFCRKFVLRMNKMLLKSADDLEERILEVGFLPYFAGDIHGFSVEEMTWPKILWDDENGPWIWKGEITRRLNCAYGKFCKRRAAYISLDLLPYFIAYRRYIYSNYNKTSSLETDRKILGLIREHESLLTGELKKLAGYTRPRSHRLTPLENLTQIDARKHKAANAGFDSVMARLQMSGYVVIADFEYNYDKEGNRRGFGVARYTTPEALYGNDIACLRDINPWVAYEHIISHLENLHFPGANRKLFDKLISF